jgi:prefoldin subunit 5
MELQEQIASLESEKKNYLSFIEAINAEKIALDQLLVETLKSSLSAKKDLCLSNAKLQILTQENNELKKKQEEMQQKIDQLTNDIYRMASHAQSSEG